MMLVEDMRRAMAESHAEVFLLARMWLSRTRHRPLSMIFMTKRQSVLVEPPSVFG